MPRPVLKIKEPYVPEMLPNAVKAIEKFLSTKEDPTAFEFGGGYSTVWLAGLCKRVVWVESDNKWHEETGSALREAQLLSKSKDVLVGNQSELGSAIDTYGEFDLILVDCLDSERAAAVEHAIEHVAPGGMLVLDDSQWPMLEPSKALLDDLGWKSTHFHGNHTRKNGVVKHHETTLYLKPEPKKVEPKKVEAEPAKVETAKEEPAKPTAAKSKKSKTSGKGK